MIQVFLSGMMLLSFFRLGLIFVFFTQTSPAQSVLDSLRQKLQKASTDSHRIDIMILMSKELREDYPDSGLLITRQAEPIAMQGTDQFRLAKIWHERAVCFDFANQLDSCFYYLEKADNLFTNLKQFERKAAVLNDYGSAYFFRSNYELATRFYLQALDGMKKYGHSKDVAKILNNLGLIAKARKNYPEATEYFRQSLILKRVNKDSKGELNTLINIGSMFQRREIFDSAYYYANEALALSITLNNKREQITCRSNMAAALVSGGKHQEAEPLLQAAEREALSMQYKMALPTIYESFGMMYSLRGNYSQALQSYQHALHAVEQLKALEPMANFYKALAVTSAKIGNYQTAYYYLDSAKLLFDSLINIENSRHMNEMNAVYERSEKEKEISNLNLKNNLQSQNLATSKLQRNLFILAFALFLALFIVAFRAYRLSRRQQKQLDEQNHLIQKSLEEKEILLKEIHHRVKNNLQIVSSLLSLQANYIDDRKALDAVRESKNRVQSMAIIHQHLYQDESLMNIGVREYIEQMSAYLLDAYNIRKGQIELEMQVQEISMDIDTMVPLGLMLNELINNCLKYAFPDGKQGTIRILLKKIREGIQLSVYDNGIGIKPDLIHYSQNSFGHKMIESFMKKLKGTINIYNEDGTRIDLFIPLIEKN